MEDKKNKKAEKKNAHFNRNEVTGLVIVAGLSAFMYYSGIFIFGLLLDVLFFGYILDKAYNQKSS